MDGIRTSVTQASDRSSPPLQPRRDGPRPARRGQGVPFRAATAYRRINFPGLLIRWRSPRATSRLRARPGRHLQSPGGAERRHCKSGWNIGQQPERLLAVRQYGLLGYRASEDTSSFTDTTMALSRGSRPTTRGASTRGHGHHPRRRSQRLALHHAAVPVPGLPVRAWAAPDGVADRNMPGSSWNADTTSSSRRVRARHARRPARDLLERRRRRACTRLTSARISSRSSRTTSRAPFPPDRRRPDRQTFRGPTDVTVDLSGFIYALDAGPAGARFAERRVRPEGESRRDARVTPAGRGRHRGRRLADVLGDATLPR